MMLPKLALMLLFLCGCRAYAAPSTLVVVPNVSTVVARPDAAFWQFAPRSLSDETPLTHTFLLRNDTKATLTIERVAVSCDCVQVSVAESPSLPVQIAPGRTVPVQLALSLRRLVPGPVSKSAWLYLRGGRDNGLQLEIRGTVRDEPPSSR